MVENSSGASVPIGTPSSVNSGQKTAGQQTATIESPLISPQIVAGQISWPLVAWFGGLLLLCYWPILYRMGHQWATDENMGHGFFVPIMAGFIAWQRRNELLATPRHPNVLGLLVVVFGGLLSVAATLGAELFTARVSFVIALFGTVLFLGGTRWMKILLFPLALLLFMIPIPAIVYSALTMKLQTLASELGEFMISAMGIPVLREGNTLKLPSQTLDIAEACSGIRSLMTLLFLSLFISYFMDKKVWMRWALLVATVPIAIGANGVRVAATGLLSEIDTKLATGVYHEVEGYIVYIVALVALLAVHRLINVVAHRFGKA
jgi:exosortase